LNKNAGVVVLVLIINTCHSTIRNHIIRLDDVYVVRDAALLQLHLHHHYDDDDDDGKIRRGC
jgi:hypothetical protein